MGKAAESIRPAGAAVRRQLIHGLDRRPDSRILFVKLKAVPSVWVVIVFPKDVA